MCGYIILPFNFKYLQNERAYELYKNGLIKVKDVMSICNIAKSTFYKGV